MADEIVYRLVLDGQAGGPGSTSSSGAFPSTRTSQAASQTDEPFNPFAGAMARIQREQRAEQEDRAYRAMKQNKNLQQVEEEDKKGAAEKQEADSRRQKLAEDPYAMARELLARQSKADELRLAMAAVTSNSTIEAVREKEANARLAAETARRLDEQEKDQAAREDAARQEEQARLARDPVHLAQQAMQREQLGEKTRLEKLAMQRGDGHTADSVHREEVAREQARTGAQWAQRGGNALARIATGTNPINAGLDIAAASGGPIVGALAQTAGALLSAVKANANEARRINKEITPFSPSLTMANVTEDIKDIKFKIGLAREQGGRRAELERESRELDRREMRTGTTSLALDNMMREGWMNLKDNMRTGLQEALKALAPDAMKKIKDEDEAKNRAEEAKRKDFLNNLPPPFHWVKDPDMLRINRKFKNDQKPQPAVQGPGPFLKMPGV